VLLLQPPRPVLPQVLLRVQQVPQRLAQQVLVQQAVLPREALQVVPVVQPVADQPVAVAEETLVVLTLAAAMLVASLKALMALILIQTVRVTARAKALLMRLKFHKRT
jgi:hypothetical protein